MMASVEAAEMCEYERKCEIIAEVIRFVQINDFVSRSLFIFFRLCDLGVSRAMCDGACHRFLTN